MGFSSQNHPHQPLPDTTSMASLPVLFQYQQHYTMRYGFECSRNYCNKRRQQGALTAQLTSTTTKPSRSPSPESQSLWK